MKSSYSVSLLRGMVVFDMVVLDGGCGHQRHQQPQTDWPTVTGVGCDEGRSLFFNLPTLT